ncbi:MAG: sigma-54 dependent transcriptional regulator [Paramuribaculum sp.]|nr:sigma-54 dependent transcriptional regulator [Paramuribaculum sp.]
MILIIDDDKAIRLSLSVLLRRAGYEVSLAATPEEAIDLVRNIEFRLIIMDMNYSRGTSGDEGLELLQKCKIFQPDTPVILMTAWGSIPLAVAGIQAGAFDFITKPWNNQLLLERIRTALTLTDTKHDIVGTGKFDRNGIIGKSQAITDVLKTAERVAPTSAPVLILGENGTGKELIANAIHINSPRAKAPFVMVNLGGISQSLFESEMFGHTKGAFTGAVSARKGRFEMADKGTIFLDEIGDLDPASQVKMLRVLQQHTFEALGDSKPRKVDIRVICATNADLPAMVADHTFREDLYYRINLITLKLPPLRERREDIPLLVNHFARMNAEATGTGMPEITSDAMTWLMKQPYPGNIRELKNLIERTMIVSGSSRLDTADFIASSLPEARVPTAQNLSGATLEDLERNAIVSALDKHSGNLTRVAEALGITRQSLYRRMEKLGINPDKPSL